jgi:hypothetical protein
MHWQRSKTQNGTKLEELSDTQPFFPSISACAKFQPEIWPQKCKCGMKIQMTTSDWLMVSPTLQKKT